MEAIRAPPIAKRPSIPLLHFINLNPLGSPNSARFYLAMTLGLPRQTTSRSCSRCLCETRSYSSLFKYAFGNDHDRKSNFAVGLDVVHERFHTGGDQAAFAGACDLTSPAQSVFQVALRAYIDSSLSWHGNLGVEQVSYEYPSGKAERSCGEKQKYAEFLLTRVQYIWDKSYPPMTQLAHIIPALLSFSGSKTMASGTRMANKSGKAAR